MEHQQFCQSCGMPLDEGNRGTNADGSRNDDYCVCMYLFFRGKRYDSHTRMSWNRPTRFTCVGFKRET